MAVSLQPRGKVPRLEYVVMLPWLWLRRSRGWRRRVLQLSYLLVVLLAALGGWLAVCLSGLPDVGDPFDVKAFERGRTVPDSENAFVLYRQALERVTTDRVTPDASLMWNAVWKGWAQAPPEVRAWIEANRAALELWRRGTERPDARLDPPRGSGLHGEQPILVRLDTLAGAAVLEGSRLQQAGDMAGAWNWHRAGLRYSLHLRRHGRIQASYIAERVETWARGALIDWARDPRTGPVLLREALGEVLAIHGRTPGASETLKAEYVALMHGLDDPEALMSRIDSFEEMRRGYLVLWFLKREPERSRRVTRLVFANRLAQCDKPLNARPPAVDLQPEHPILALYQADPEAPYAARALPPKTIFAWLDSSTIIWRFLPMFSFFEETTQANHRSRAVLIVSLAEQLYQRERGTTPPTAGALVGSYLKALPHGYVAPDDTAKTP
jgi:hypothetical protein